MLNNPKARMGIYVGTLILGLLVLLTDAAAAVHWITPDAAGPIKDDLNRLLALAAAVSGGTAFTYLGKQQRNNTLALSGPIEDQAVTAVQATVAQAQAGQAGLQKLIEALGPLIAPAPPAPTPAVAPLYPPSTWNGTQPPITVGDAAP